MLSAIYIALLRYLDSRFSSLLRTAIPSWRVVATAWLMLLFLQLSEDLSCILQCVSAAEANVVSPC